MDPTDGADHQITPSTSNFNVENQKDGLTICNSTIKNESGQQIFANTVTINQYSQSTTENKKNQCPVELPYRFRLPDPVQNFSGRKDELKNIHQSLEKKSIAILSQVVAISGLGGIGKTETAKMYAKEYADFYDIIMYVLGENKLSLINNFCQIASDFMIEIEYKMIDENNKAIRITKPIKSIVDNLYKICSSCGKSLFIIDNVEDCKDVIDYFPRGSFSSNKPRILITSRRRNWDLDDYGELEPIHLKVFTLEDTIEFFGKSLSCELYILDDIRKLCDLLNSLPLALKQSVSFVKAQNRKFKMTSTKYTIGDYLLEFKQSATKLLNHQNDACMYQFTVLNTWKMTTSRLETQYGNVGIRAVRILEYLAYLASDDIHCNIFRIEDDAINQQAVLLLEEYSMIDIENNTISIHRLVQKVVRIELRSTGREESVLEEVMNLLYSYHSNESLRSHICAVWEIASRYPNILEKFYKYSILVEIISQKNPNLATLDALLDYEYRHGNCLNIFNTLKPSIKFQNLDVIKRILELLDNCGYLYNMHSLLFTSILCRSESVSIFFLDKTRDFNVKFKDNLTPFVMACYLGMEDLLKYLLDNQEHPYDIDGFFLACSKNNVNIMRIIMDKQIFDMNQKNKKGLTVIMHALNEKCEEEVVNILIDVEKLDFDVRDNEGNTVLMYACGYGTPDIVRKLIKSTNFDPEAKNKNGNTAFMCACGNGSAESVKILIESGKFDVKTRNNYGYTPLDHACVCDNFDVVDVLLNLDEFDLNQVDDMGRTVLHKVFLTRIDFNRWSTLNRKRLLNSLVERGCDPQIKDHHDKTAYDYIRDWETAILAKWFKTI